MNKWIKFDERTDFISGKLAFIFLGLTQAGLLISIYVQRYVYGRPPNYYNDTAIVFGISVIGFWITNLYLGGAIPSLTVKSLIWSYIVMVLLIAVPYTIIRGLPRGSEWLRWVLVILVAPAVLISGYAAVAALGKKRLDHLSTH